MKNLIIFNNDILLNPRAKIAIAEKLKICFISFDDDDARSVIRPYCMPSSNGRIGTSVSERIKCVSESVVQFNHCCTLPHHVTLNYIWAVNFRITF